MNCYLCDDCQDELEEAIGSAEAMAISGAIQRIDLDKLAKVIYGAPEPPKGTMKHFAWLEAASIADAVLDALPGLMGGGER